MADILGFVFLCRQIGGDVTFWFYLQPERQIYHVLFFSAGREAEIPRLVFSAGREAEIPLLVFSAGREAEIPRLFLSAGREAEIPRFVFSAGRETEIPLLFFSAGREVDPRYDGCISDAPNPPALKQR